METKQVLRAVFFDLDGTLLYTLPDIARAVNHALKKNSLPMHKVEAYREIVGWGLSMTIRKAVPADITDPSVLDKIRRDMKIEYSAHPVVDTVPYPGIINMLHAFQDLHIPMGIISNKDHSLTSVIVKKVLHDFTFAGVCGSSSQIPPKPDTTGIRQLMADTGLEAGEILFVGDTSIDMQTALAVGAYPLGVSWGYRTTKELRDAGAAGVADSPEDIVIHFSEMMLDRAADA